MDKLIYRYKPFDYTTYVARQYNNSTEHYTSFLLGIYNLIMNNPDLQEWIEEYFVVEYSKETTGTKPVNLLFLGNSSLIDTNSQIRFYAGSSNTDVDIHCCLYFKNNSAIARSDNVTIPRNVVINLAPLKNGGFIFWIGEPLIRSFYFLVTKVKNNLTNLYTTEVMFGNGASLKCTIPIKDISGFYNDRIDYSILPHSEIKMQDISAGRYDYRGYNITKGGGDFILYPYYNDEYSFLDLYYYDGGNCYIENKELVYIGDRVFLGLKDNNNFLIELKTKEDDNI